MKTGVEAAHDVGSRTECRHRSETCLRMSFTRGAERLQRHHAGRVQVHENEIKIAVRFKLLSSRLQAAGFEHLNVGYRGLQGGPKTFSVQPVNIYN